MFFQYSCEHFFLHEMKSVFALKLILYYFYYKVYMNFVILVRCAIGLALRNIALWIKINFKTFSCFHCFLIMEFPNELKELYPNQIIEVRGNAEALTVILKTEVDIIQFSNALAEKYKNLDEPKILFIKHENKQDFHKLILE